MTSKRIGNKPASCRFDSKSSCVSSSVNSGAARNVTTPTFALAAEVDSGGSVLTGLTLNRELPHEAFKSSRDNKGASEAIDRYFVAPFMIFWLETSSRSESLHRQSQPCSSRYDEVASRRSC